MNKDQVYKVVTDYVIQQLEKGEKLPWTKPWKSHGLRPANFLTKNKPYRGVNAFLTKMTPHEVPYYLTFNQIKKHEGWSLQKGSKSIPLVYWKRSYQSEKTGKWYDHISKIPAGEPFRVSFMLKYYRVFNIADVDGLKYEAPPSLRLAEHERINKAEKIVKDWNDKPTIKHRLGDAAFYMPGMDEVVMPELGQFNTPEEYYSTLFHELTHSTGHSSRLNRFENTNGKFGSKDYSFEELIAEMGAAFLSGVCDIRTEDLSRNSLAYIQGWLSKLKSEPKWLVDAAGKAQRAADMIQNIKFEDETKQSKKSNKKAA